MYMRDMYIRQDRIGMTARARVTLTTLKARREASKLREMATAKTSF